MILSYKRIFLIDSLGALLSAFLLGVILVKFEIAFGIPLDVLYCLTIFASVLSIFSFFNYLFAHKNSKICLKIVGLVNILYSWITMIIVLYFYEKITGLGLLYFLIEISIIVILAKIELEKANH